MGTFAPHHIQTDQFSYLRSHDGLYVFVIRKPGNAAFARSRILSIINQYRNVFAATATIDTIGQRNASLPCRVVARIGAPVFPLDRPFYDQVIAALKDHLDYENYAIAWTESQAMGFEGACSQD